MEHVRYSTIQPRCKLTHSILRLFLESSEIIHKQIFFPRFFFPDFFSLAWQKGAHQNERDVVGLLAVFFLDAFSAVDSQF
jgi:hypothetical protein